MPAPVMIDDFLELGYKGGVLSRQVVDPYLEKLRTVGPPTDTPEQLAKCMVRDGLLTQFQADLLLKGKWKGFIISGKYRLLQQLGAGGMGVVYLCEHLLMRRRVAIKVLPKKQAEDEGALKRFYREARAAAALDHPNIARAHDIDHDDNLHFLVMEYVDGGSLQEIVRRTQPLDPVRAAHYIRQAAFGLQHAHEAGLVHRDIKPGNILVDRTGIVKILDMGLARFFHDTGDELTHEFDSNSTLGTADYLAPEQAVDSHTVDIRADIYGLGGTFYFLLTGRSPFQEGTVREKLIWHQVRMPTPVSKHRPDVPEELAAIIFKMMEKEPAKRYQTPGEVAEALEPFTRGTIAPPTEQEMPRPSPAPTGASTGDGPRSPALTGRVAAGEKSSPPAPTRRTASAPPLDAGRASGSASGRVPQMSIDTSTGGSRTPNSTPRPAAPQPAPAEAGHIKADSGKRHLRESAPQPGPAERSGRSLAPMPVPVVVGGGGSARIWWRVGIACGAVAIVYLGVMVYAVSRGPDQPPGPPKRQLPAFQPEPQAVAQPQILVGHSRPVESVAVSPNGKLALTASWDKNIQVWDLESGQPLRTLRGHTKEVHAVAFAPDGRRALSAGWDNAVRLWDVIKGVHLKEFAGHDKQAQSVAIAPDGRTAASGGSDNVIRIWDLDTRKETHVLRGHTKPVWGVAFAASPRVLVSGSYDGTVRVWDVDKGEETHKLDGHKGNVHAVAASPNGRLIVSGGSDHTAILWDLDSGKRLRDLKGHKGVVAAVTFSPDGRYVLTGGDDQTLRIWEVGSGQEVRRYEGHTGPVWSVACTADGKSAVSGSRDNSARVWALPPYLACEPARVAHVFAKVGGSINRVAVAPDGARGAVAAQDGTIRLYDLRGRAPGRTIRYPGKEKVVNGVTFSPDGQFVLVCGRDKGIHLFNANTGAESKQFIDHTASVSWAAFNPAGNRIVSASQDKTARIWDISKAAVVHTLNHPQPVNFAVYSPDGKRVATACNDKSVRVWDAASGKQVRKLDGHTARVTCAAFTADGKYVLTASDDRTVRVWDAETGAPLRKLEGHTDAVWVVAPSWEPRYVLSAGKDRTIRLWDVESGRELWQAENPDAPLGGVAFAPGGPFAFTGGHDRAPRLWSLPPFLSQGPPGLVRKIDGHGAHADRVAFHPDGKRVVSVSHDKTARVWELASGRELSRFNDHADTLHFVSVSPDGKYAVTASNDKTVRVWDVGSGAEIRVLDGHEKRVWSAVFTPDGRRVFSGGEDGTARLWDVEGGVEIRDFRGHSRPINWVAVSPDGKLGATAGWDGTVRLWDLETGNEVKKMGGGNIPHASTVAFSPDGKLVLSGHNDKGVRLWEAATGKLLHNFEGHTQALWVVTFSPDGTRALSGGPDKTLRLWDVHGRRLIHTFQGHTAGVTGAAFSPDGRYAVTSCADKSVRLWSLPR